MLCAGGRDVKPRGEEIISSEAGPGEGIGPIGMTAGELPAAIRKSINQLVAGSGDWAANLI